MKLAISKKYKSLNTNSRDKTYKFIYFKWWKNSDFVGKLPFARNRLVECYFWILGMYNEPYYAVSRRILVK
ncbi:hypothetical protein ACOSQ4_017565 [Xanthoceras sorbifolium]